MTKNTAPDYRDKHYNLLYFDICGSVLSPAWPQDNQHGNNKHNYAELSFMLSIAIELIVLSAVMLTVFCAECCNIVHYAECHFADCRYAVYRNENRSLCRMSLC